MYDELVKRLREHNGWALNETLDEAADAIEKLSMKLHGDEAAIAGMKREIECMVRAEKPRWIPVTERLPEDSRYVLVCDVFGDITLGYRHRMIIGGIKYPESWELCEDLDGAVTHWMPLPEPPKEEV